MVLPNDIVDAAVDDDRVVSDGLHDE